MANIAYKPNVDDMRESPSVEVMEQLRKSGAEVSYSDPWVPVFPRMRKYKFDLKSTEIDGVTLTGFDCVIIGTNHDSFDYPMIAKYAKTLVDSRGVFREKQSHVFPA